MAKVKLKTLFEPQEVELLKALMASVKKSPNRGTKTDAVIEAMNTNSTNFSAMSSTQTQSDYEEEPEYDPGDGGVAADAMTSGIQADIDLIKLLMNFNDRQKIILLYQILRESGYNLNHADCAMTLSLTREHYMFLLSDMKGRSKKILQRLRI